MNLIYSKFQLEQKVKEHTKVATHKNSQGELKVTKSLITIQRIALTTFPLVG